MGRNSRPRSELICTYLLICFPATATGNTLPIGCPAVVPDKRYRHVELVLNPYELNSFAEVDANQNRLLDREEMTRFREVGVALLLGENHWRRTFRKRVLHQQVAEANRVAAACMGRGEH